MCWCYKYWKKSVKSKDACFELQTGLDQWFLSVCLPLVLLAAIDVKVNSDMDMSWLPHVKNCVSKANQRLGLIKRTLGFNVSENVKKHVVLPLSVPY